MQVQPVQGEGIGYDQIWKKAQVKSEWPHLDVLTRIAFPLVTQCRQDAR